MAMLMIKCPSTGEPVATGIEIEFDSLVQLPNVRSDLACPACGSQHVWHPHEAWLDGSGADEPG